MARDAMGLWAICEQDVGGIVPEPEITNYIHDPGDFLTYVDIDFSAYRKEGDTKDVRD